jgi:hypothetical protein
MRFSGSFFSTAANSTERPSALRALIVPWCASQIVFAIDRPIPNPPFALLRDLSAR